MKSKDFNDFIEYLKGLNLKRYYVSEVFINWCIKRFSLIEESASDMFDENSRKLFKKINDYIQSCKKKDIYPEFIFDEYDSDVLLKYSLQYEVNDRHEFDLKIEKREELYNLLKEISWREFEILSKVILQENQIQDVTVTKSQSDQGIDFYGYFHFPKHAKLPRFYNYFNFRIIGQVKHSTNNKGVDHQKVASFGTELNKLRKSTDSSYFINIDDNFIKSNLPILGVFITNSYYPSKAENFANEYGIIYWDGEQIAQDLSLEVVINQIVENTTQKLSLEKFREFIQKLEMNK